MAGLLTEATPIPVEQFTAEILQWLTNDRLDYVRQQTEQDPELTFTPVATPNVELKDHNELFAAARQFGKNGAGSPQDHETWIYDEQMEGNLYRSYTTQELAGTNSDNGNAIQFSLIPSKTTPELKGMTTQQQRQAFANDLHPAMNKLKVPSVLEAITYWHTLRNQLPKVPDNNGNIKLQRTQQLADLNTTYIRHFNLEDKSVDSGSFVPSSFVYGVGGPVLRNSDADLRDDARLSVG
jgi:hypothetical protein